jgi:hypothetical protein
VNFGYKLMSNDRFCGWGLRLAVMVKAKAKQWEYYLMMCLQVIFKTNLYEEILILILIFKDKF